VFVVGLGRAGADQDEVYILTGTRGNESGGNPRTTTA